MSADLNHAEESRPNGAARLALLILAATAARCYGAATTPMLASEAYYWLWGRHLALGYIDHPPMVGWMSRLFFGWIDGSELAARASAIVLSAATTLVVYALAKTLFGKESIAWRAAVFFSLAPIFAFGGMLLQPDNGLALFCALTWLCSWRAITADQSKTDRVLALWLLTGLVAGLALLSKFHAWVILPPLYLFMLFSPAHRLQLARPGPWLSLALALLVLSPNLYWNAHNEWPTYFYQMHRSGLGKSHFSLGHFLTYAAGPLITLSPVIYAGVIAALVKAARSRDCRTDPAILFLIFAGLPLPLFLGILSTRVSISLHWPSTGYIPLLILLAAMMERGLIPAALTFRRMWATAATLSLIMVLAPSGAHLLPTGLASPWRSKEINIDRLLRETINWGSLGDHVRTALAALPKDAPAVFMTRDMHLASILGFSTSLSDDCFVIPGGVAHSFDTWRADRGGLIGVNAIAIFSFSKQDSTEAKRQKQIDGFKDDLAPSFKEVAKPYYFAYNADGTTAILPEAPAAEACLRAFIVFDCRHFLGSPEKEKL